MKPKQKPRVFCEFNKMFFDLETSTCMVFSFVKTFINGKKSSKVFANNLNKITKFCSTFYQLKQVIWKYKKKESILFHIE